MAGRVRFSSQPGVTHTIPASSEVTLDDLRKLPLPRLYTSQSEENAAYQMDLFTAASIGALEIIEAHLKRSPNVVNACNRNGWSALLYAAQLNHTEITDLLLKHGANVNLPNNKGQTALMLAAACGHPNTVKKLLEKGADVKARDRRKRQALHAAASCSQDTIVAELLKHGADPNAADEDGMTPTLEACSATHEKTLKALIEKGGNAHVRNTSGEDGVMLAAESRAVLEMINAVKVRSLDELLMRMNLEKHCDTFREQKVDTLALFLELNDQDLNDMQIKYGPRKKMLAVINHYKKYGELKLDAVDIVPGARPQEAKPSESNAEIVSTLRYIATQNDKCKRFAIAAFEHKDDPARLIEFLPEIMGCCDNIASKLAKYTN